MNDRALEIAATGMVTSVGLHAMACCAAIRAKLARPTQSRFISRSGQWRMVHEVPLPGHLRGAGKLARMAAMAAAECLHGLPPPTEGTLAMILCVSERGRRGRWDDLEDRVFLGIERELSTRFSPDSLVVAQGRTGVAVAMDRARGLVHERGHSQVLIVAADTMLSGATLGALERDGRLLDDGQSNGFMPGEAAAAFLVSAPTGRSALLCRGIGFGREAATVVSEQPLRGDGLVQAIRATLQDSQCSMGEVDLRLADLSGEQYYFKEASLALTRVLRERREVLDIWHPAECIGETGAAVGAVLVGVARSAMFGACCPGRTILCHLSDDDGRRAALLLAFDGEMPRRD